MKTINNENLENAVPERIFWRGEDLYNEGAIQDVKVSKEEISVKIMGTLLYTVKSKLTAEGIMFACTCLYEGLCKHRVALGLCITENLNDVSKTQEIEEPVDRTPDIDALLKQANPEKKDHFLRDVLSESSLLLERFGILLKGAQAMGGDIDITRLAKDIKAELEAFDLNDYSRFYDDTPDHYGYLEEWEILQEGAEFEFNTLFRQFTDRVFELLEIHNIIAAFKHLLAIYEAAKKVDFENIDDPVAIFEAEGLYDLVEIDLQQLLNAFSSQFTKLSFTDDVYRSLIDIFFERINARGNKQIYQMNDFNDILINCVQSADVADKLFRQLQKSKRLPETDYCELLLVVHEKTGDTKQWLEAAERYYKGNKEVAEKLVNHYADHKEKLVQLAQDLAFSFNIAFIPFFYNHLSKEDHPQLYHNILKEYIKQSQTVEHYRELKEAYGSDAEWAFIDGLKDQGIYEKFYIRLLQEEKAFEKLLSIAREKSDLYQAMSYLRPIVNVYPDEVLDVIARRTERFLQENKGRHYYRQAAEWLKVLKQIKDKKAAARTAEFINHLLERFNKRPAMIDEFRKAGVG